MKISTATLFSAPILALANAVLPLGTRELVSRAPVCQRESAEVSDFIQSGFTGKAEVTYITSGAGIAFSVCRIVNHHGGSNFPCTEYALLAASVLAPIIMSQASQNTPVEGAKPSGRRQASIAAHQTFADHFAGNGLVWEQIETPTVTRRGNTSDEVDEHFIIRGVAHPDLTITPADIHYTSFANGTGFVHAIHEPANTALHKRHDGAGFKYNWRCGYWDPKAANGDVRSPSARLAQDISNDWASKADIEKMDEWIGAAGLDYIVLKLFGVAIRIIPELRGFGEEYESVDICGNMDGPIHDEL